MATRTYSRPGPYPGFTLENYSNNSTNSPRVDGKLVLRARSHAFTLNRITAFGSNFAGNDCAGAQTIPFPWTSQHNNEVYGKFVGQLRSGSASLGVSFASWQQTADMITDRLEKCKTFFKPKKSGRAPPRRSEQDAYGRKRLASDVLEGEFGWVPLVSDIHASLVTACGEKAVPSTWCRASSRFTHYDSTVQTTGFNPHRFTTINSTGRLTYAAAVAVTNPNLWLLNRLGLINPITVAWDLVPWSFVVNMFVNVNSVIGSLTDTVGLTISDGSYTRSVSGFKETRAQWHSNVADNRVSWANSLSRTKNRTTGALTPPSLQLRAPKLDWNLLAISSALLVQKVKAFH